MPSSKPQPFVSGLSDPGSYRDCPIDYRTDDDAPAGTVSGTEFELGMMKQDYLAELSQSDEVIPLKKER
jgi:hypothetical protein